MFHLVAPPSQNIAAMDPRNWPSRRVGHWRTNQTRFPPLPLQFPSFPSRELLHPVVTLARYQQRPLHAGLNSLPTAPGDRPPNQGLVMPQGLSDGCRTLSLVTCNMHVTVSPTGMRGNYFILLQLKTEFGI
ncbi:hypothetical protein HU200_059093 [Digitaria exilis]|uniref:Uncharacterized protein n=1 Tax=Digitaria exilis TaxID=1010633 RepID=A0A835DZY2_9POAL|nr:hypothetical protein HU200_059093 [Digitaria exilis]